MKTKLVKFVALMMISSVAYAGFGRGGSSGGSRSSFSSSSSRSYSAPSYRNYSSSSSYNAPRRTIVREYHTNTVNTASGGVHPLVAGMAGYMVGDALNRNHGSSQPQVVYVNGQPQQVQAAPQQVVQDAQPQVVSAPMQPQQEPVEDHSYLFWTFITLLFLFTVGVLVNFKNKEN